MRDVKAVANHLILSALRQEVALSGQQIQGLIYLAHGARLALLGEPLIDRAVYAFAGGISIPGLNRAGLVGDGLVSRPVVEIVCKPNGLLDDAIPVLEADDSALESLDRVLVHFGEGGDTWLRQSIFRDGGPWHQVWHSPERVGERLGATLSGDWDDAVHLEKPAVIPNSLIREWFRARLIRRQKQQSVDQGVEPTVRMTLA